MEVLLSNLINGWELITNIETIFWMILGTFLGIIVGIIPGLSSGTALAILLPITFTISPLNGLVFLFSTYVAVTYGGSLTAIVMNTPGAPESAATAIEGYPLTMQGKSSQAIGTALFSSFLGGILSYISLLVTISILGTVAAYFSPVELFLVSMIGVLILGSMGTGSPVKIFISGFLGLLIGTIGITPSGEHLATFGSNYLAEGVQLIPAIIGVFVLSEVLSFIGRNYIVEDLQGKDRIASLRGLLEGFKYPFVYLYTLIRSIIIGQGIGILPAAGATMAAFASYGATKRLSKKTKNFGKGAFEGIVASESANNASSAGAIMTTLTLGVPGSLGTAVMLGALSIHGLQVGPQFLNQQGPLVYGLILAAILAQPFILLAGSVAGLFFSNVLSLKVRFIVPFLIIFSMIGAFSIRHYTFDIFIMIGIGVFSYFLKVYNYSLPALILGIILSPIGHKELIKAIQIHGDDTLQAFFTRPLSIVLILFIVWIIYRSIVRTVRINKGIGN